MHIGDCLFKTMVSKISWERTNDEEHTESPIYVCLPSRSILVVTFKQTGDTALESFTLRSAIKRRVDARNLTRCGVCRHATF